VKRPRLSQLVKPVKLKIPVDLKLDSSHLHPDIDNLYLFSSCIIWIQITGLKNYFRLSEPKFKLFKTRFKPSSFRFETSASRFKLFASRFKISDSRYESVSKFKSTTSTKLIYENQKNEFLNFSSIFHSPNILSHPSSLFTTLHFPSLHFECLQSKVFNISFAIKLMITITQNPF
jgi:hypothetical protein